GRLHLHGAGLRPRHALSRRLPAAASRLPGAGSSLRAVSAGSWSRARGLGVRFGRRTEAHLAVFGQVARRSIERPAAGFAAAVGRRPTKTNTQPPEAATSRPRSDATSPDRRAPTVA